MFYVHHEFRETCMMGVLHVAGCVNPSESLGFTPVFLLVMCDILSCYLF